CPHLFHGALIFTAPGIGESGIIEGDAFRLEQRLGFPRDRVAPIDQRAEHVKKQGLDRKRHRSLVHESLNHESLNHESLNHESLHHGSHNHESLNHESLNHGSLNHESLNHESLNHGSLNHGSLNHGSLIAHLGASRQSTGSQTPSRYF